MKRIVLTMVLILLVGAAPAEAWLGLAAVTTTPGRIGIILWAWQPFPRVDLFERVSGEDVFLRTVVPPSGAAEDATIFGSYPDVVRWRCDRTTRSFIAVGHHPDGTTETASFDVRTPSCRERLRLIAPPQVRAGATVRVRILDTFELGGIAPRVCVRPPKRSARCRIVRVHGTEASLKLRTGRGRWLVTLTTPQQHLRAVLSAGVPPPRGTSPPPTVLATGDSEMLNVDASLSDQLVNRAYVRSDVYPGGRLTINVPVSWRRVAARQVRRLHPDATVLFIGANDYFPMTTSSGATVQCCGTPWITEYARRVRGVTRTYLSRGGRAVVWINVPLARDRRLNPVIAGVDQALPEGISGIPNASVIDLASLLTPGGVYRDDVTINGRSVRVRQNDGVHLSPAGGAIAARAVVSALERLHIV